MAKSASAGAVSAIPASALERFSHQCLTKRMGLKVLANVMFSLIFARVSVVLFVNTGKRARKSGVTVVAFTFVISLFSM